ncbi:MAG: hypothetical protein OEY14_01430, partial [Myxococcales bacterium]|nr:hypothetical protein [Myxococcales bacterium]
TAVLGFAQANPAQIAPAVAQVRLSAIEAATAQERRYMDVRQRIAEREEELRQEAAAEAARPRRRRGRSAH